MHSPSAYRYVREVIRLPRGMGYYAYATLPTTTAPVDCRLLYRIILDLQPTTYTVACNDPEQKRAIEAVVSAAAPDAKSVDTDADLAIVCGNTDFALDYRVAVVAPASHPLVERRCQRAGSGHIYRSSSAAIVREDSNVPFQVFDIAF